MDYWAQQSKCFKNLYICVSLPARTRASLALSPNCSSRTENDSEAHPPSYRMGSEDILPGVKPREADNSPLVPRLWMHGVIPPPPYTSSWSGAYLLTRTYLLYVIRSFVTWRCVDGQEVPDVSTNRISFVFKVLDVQADGEGEGRTFFRNVRNCLPSETASHPVSTVSSITPLWKDTKLYLIRWWSASRTD